MTQNTANLNTTNENSNNANLAKLRKILISPEDFGAVGDGLTRDGDAFNKMIAYVNKLDRSFSVYILVKTTYNIVSTGDKIKDVHLDQISNIRGLIPITKNNIVIDGMGSGCLFVEEKAPFNKTSKGKSSSDRFIHGLHFQGQDCTICNLKIDGNIEQRKVNRGPLPYGYGGQEFGVILGGKNNQIHNCEVVGWGTDCIFIYGDNNSIIRCSIGRARRNCISVVPYPLDEEEYNQDFHTSYIRSTTIHEGGNGDQTIWNRPGTGIQVESGKRSAKTFAKIMIDKCIFENNNKSDLQLSKNAYQCHVTSSTFEKTLNLRPFQRGGHKIHHNEFRGKYSIVCSRNKNATTPISLKFNKHKSLALVRRSGNRPYRLYGKQLFILKDNIRF